MPTQAVPGTDGSIRIRIMKSDKKIRRTVHSEFWRNSVVGLVSIICVSFAEAEESTMHRWEVAGRDPDRIVLSITEDPSSTAAVTWRTSTNITSGWAEIALAAAEPGFTANAERVEAVTQRLDLSQATYNPTNSVTFHTASFTGLKPDTQYAYRVGDGREYMSEWFHFRTAAEGFKPFSFVYVGDAQNGLLSHWSRLVRQAFRSAPDMAFFLHAGDLINTPHLDSEWGEWFKALGWIHGLVPSVAVPGNHEYGNIGEGETARRTLSIQWRPQFEFPVVEDLPSELHETAYSFEFQGVLFIALNSMAKQDAQTEWMDKVLEESNHQWKVVTFHYPIFASAINRDNLALRTKWKPVFDRHNVDLVLQGHDHTYARGHTRLIKAGPIEDYVRSVYVNSVSGSKMYTVKPDRWNDYSDEDLVMVRMAENTQLFQVLSVDHRTIEYKAIMPTGEVYDAFTLEKFPDGSKKIVNGLVTRTPERTFRNTLPYGR